MAEPTRFCETANAKAAERRANRLDIYTEAIRQIRETSADLSEKQDRVRTDVSRSGLDADPLVKYADHLNALWRLSSQLLLACTDETVDAFEEFVSAAGRLNSAIVRVASTPGDKSDVYDEIRSARGATYDAEHAFIRAARESLS